MTVIEKSLLLPLSSSLMFKVNTFQYCKCMFLQIWENYKQILTYLIWRNH